MRYYRCKHFRLRELVPSHVLKAKGQMAWKFIDPDVLEAGDVLRELYGPLYINGVLGGKKFNWSGLRTSESGYSPLSAHFRGCALDLKSKYYSGVHMRSGLANGYDAYQELVKPQHDVGLVNYDYLANRLFSLINEIEKGTPTWLHIAKTNRKNMAWIPRPK